MSIHKEYFCILSVDFWRILWYNEVAYKRKQKGDSQMAHKTDRIMCGTCEFWTGKRQPIFDRQDKPKIDIVDLLGQCENEQSKFCNQERKKTNKCIRFSKWTELL